MAFTDQTILQRVDELKDFAPSTESTNAAICKVRSVLEESGPTSTVLLPEPKKPVSSTRWRIVVGGVVAACLILTATLLPFGSTSVAFAEVQQQLNQLRNVTYNFVVGESSTKYIASGTLLRIDSEGGVRIIRPDLKKTLRVDHDKRRAVLTHDNRKDPLPQINYVERLRTISADSIRELGKKVINGDSVNGFAVIEPGTGGRSMEVWVDPKTLLPVRVVADENRVLQDFQYDIDLPVDTFELNVPDGYFVENEYADPQAPLRLDESQLRQYRTCVADPNRTAEQTVEAFLKLWSAGESKLAEALEVNPGGGDGIRKLDGFRDLAIESTVVHPSDPTRFLAVTNAAVSYRGQRAALIITATRRDGRWLVEDIDLESGDNVQQEIRRFLPRSIVPLWPKNGQNGQLKFSLGNEKHRKTQRKTKTGGDNER